MFKVLRQSVLISHLLALLTLNPSPAQEKANGLSAADAKLLEGLLRDFLFDPTGAQRVEATLRSKPRWSDEERTYNKVGWLVKAKDGNRLYFTDGSSKTAPPDKDLVAC